MNKSVVITIVVLLVLAFLIIYAMCKIASRDDAERERMADANKKQTGDD